MAKGNDGNLLQHWIEAELAWRLYRQGKGSRLLIVLTHGMAPYECFRSRKKPGKQEPPSGSRRLDGWLAVAKKPNLPTVPPAVVFAYRDCDASASHYPNSGEVLAALIGRGNLHGFISEVCPSKLDQLRYAWGICLARSRPQP
jgi:hypothetical protein